MIDFKQMKPLTTAGILLGVGMGGFFDGILLHQILQVHNMLSNRLFPDTVVNAEINMFWDGIFHAFTWTVTAIGLALLWRVAQKREVPLVTKFLIGSMALGWGLFNLIEGIIDHHILQVHHVVQRAEGAEQLMWDLTFLTSGVLLIGVGIYLRRESHITADEKHGSSQAFNPVRV